MVSATPNSSEGPSQLKACTMVQGQAARFVVAQVSGLVSDPARTTLGWRCRATAGHALTKNTRSRRDRANGAHPDLRRFPAVVYQPEQRDAAPPSARRNVGSAG